MSSLQRIGAVWRREFACSAASPTAWVFLVFFLVLSAFCTFIVSGVFASGQADLSSFFDWMPWLFLFMIPALGMPMWADERRTGTFELTLSFPSAMWELVLGKYLAGMTLLCVALLLTISTPLTAIYLGEPDIGAILCGYFGTILIGSVFLSISCFCSAISRSQTASFLTSLLFCALLMFIGWQRFDDMLMNYLPQSIMEIIGFCAILPHFQAFQRGIIDSGEIIYCISSTVFFLFLTCSVLKFAASGVSNIFAPGAMSEPFTRRAINKLFLSLILGLFAVLCINISASTFNIRKDLSSDQAYSLSPEARALAASLSTPATLRFYVTSGNSQMPPQLKKYAERVEWLLHEFCNASNGKLTLQMLNPEMGSPDEEAAVLEGVRPLPLNTGDRVFLGLSVSYADKTVAIPFLSPQQENILEYEVARAILNVTRKSRQKIGVISSLPVFGSDQPVNTIQRADEPGGVIRRDPPWQIITELSRDMNVFKISEETVEMPKDMNALLIIHPCALPQKLIYAIDQYLLRGGHIALYLDPRSFYSNIKSRSDYSFIQKMESEIEPLTSAWGLAYNKTLMVADMTYAVRVTRPDRNVTNPLAFKLSTEGISRTNPLTASLNSIAMYFSAEIPVFEEIPGLRYEPLLFSSKNSQIVSSLIDEPELAIRNFSPSGVQYPLAMRVSGKFKSAYIEPPDALSRDSDTPHLKESERPGEVYVFGDVDMIFNDACTREVRDALGQVSRVRQDDNLTLFQNVMDQLCGSESLTAIRGRVPMNRPLTKINDIKARAELTYRDRILDLQKNLMEAQNRVRRIQNYLTASAGQAKLSPEQEREVREYTYKEAEFKRELKALNAKLKSDLDRLDNTVRVFNLILMPLLVTIVGVVWSSFRLSKWRRRKIT